MKAKSTTSAKAATKKAAPTLKAVDPQVILGKVTKATEARSDKAVRQHAKAGNTSVREPAIEKQLAVTAKNDVPQEPLTKSKPPKPEPEVKTLYARITGFIPITCKTDLPMGQRIDMAIHELAKDPSRWVVVKPGYTNSALVRQLHEEYAKGHGVPSDPTVQGMVSFKTDDADGKTARKTTK